MRIRKLPLLLLAAAVVAGVGYFLWQPGQAAAVMAAIQNFVGQWTGPADPPPGFAKTHGRIEATRVMITTRLAGKIEEVLVREGDTVDAGQVVARMDTRSLKRSYARRKPSFRKPGTRRTPRRPSSPNGKANWKWRLGTLRGGRSCCRAAERARRISMWPRAR